jgi:hypothetical protein
VTDDGMITFFGSAHGQISPDDTFFNGMYADLPPNPPDANSFGISFGIKKSAGMTNSDLKGIYILSQIGFDPSLYVVRLKCDFDGTGGFLCTELAGGSESTSGNYSVSDDGTVTINGQSDIGQLSQDGNIFLNILANPGGEVLMAVGIRQSNGLTTADLSGIFHGVAMGHDEEENYNVRFEFTADNEGNAIFNVLEGSMSDLPLQTSDVISVDENGGIRMTNNEDTIGQISPDGKLFVLSDADDSDGEVLMLIVIRKP